LGELAAELHKPGRIHFTRRRVFVGSVDEIWSADLVDMRSFSKFNNGYKYLLTVIDTFSKYAWVVPLKSKTGKDIIDAFSVIFKDGRYPKMLWVDQGSEFYKKAFKKFLGQIKMYKTFNEGKAVIVERFHRTLKTNMWKYFSAYNTYKYINVLPDLVKKYNNTIHSSIKMTPSQASKIQNEPDVYFNLYDYNKKLKQKPKFKVGDKVRIAKKKRHFEKGYTTNWTEEIFTIDEILAYKIEDLSGESIKGSFYEQKLQKTQETFRIEKIIKRKGNKLLVKWRGYPDSFNEWINVNNLRGITPQK